MKEINHLATLSRTLCFSGHRYYAAVPEDEARLFDAVEAAWRDGYRTFISGMAPGFDLSAAEAVVRLKERLRSDPADGGRPEGDSTDGKQSEGCLQLVAAVPFTGQERGYSAADLARYKALLAAADEVRVLADRYSHGCYFRRDDWMVERSGRIICWYDGTASGTRYTVRKAVAAGLELVNLFRGPVGSLF